MKIYQDCYQNIVEKLSCGILLLNEDCRIQLWNEFMEEHSGKSSSEVLGRSLFEIFPEVSEEWFREQIESVLNMDKSSSLGWEMKPHMLTLKEKFSAEGDGGRMYQNCDLIPVPNEDGEARLVCMVVLDVTSSALYQLKLSKALMTMEKISRLDGLTDLYNRAYWESRLSEEFSRSRRYPDSSEMTLLMFDIDFFKEVNDKHGHLAGDQVLKEVASLVQDMFRNIDIPGRYGGEEFAIILPKTAIDGAKIAAERLREKISGKDVKTDSGVVSVTVSIGLAQFDGSMKSHEDLILKADTALYAAKKAGRNQVKVAD